MERFGAVLATSFFALMPRNGHFKMRLTNTSKLFVQGVLHDFNIEYPGYRHALQKGDTIELFNSKVWEYAKNSRSIWTRNATNNDSRGSTARFLLKYNPRRNESFTSTVAPKKKKTKNPDSVELPSKTPTPSQSQSFHTPTPTEQPRATAVVSTKRSRSAKKSHSDSHRQSSRLNHDRLIRELVRHVLCSTFIKDDLIYWRPISNWYRVDQRKALRTDFRLYSRVQLRNNKFKRVLFDYDKVKVITRLRHLMQDKGSLRQRSTPVLESLQQTFWPVSAQSVTDALRPYYKPTRSSANITGKRKSSALSVSNYDDDESNVCAFMDTAHKAIPVSLSQTGNADEMVKLLHNQVL